MFVFHSAPPTEKSKEQTTLQMFSSVCRSWKEIASSWKCFNAVPVNILTRTSIHDFLWLVAASKAIAYAQQRGSAIICPILWCESAVSDCIAVELSCSETPTISRALENKMYAIDLHVWLRALPRTTCLIINSKFVLFCKRRSLQLSVILHLCLWWIDCKPVSSSDSIPLRTLSTVEICMQTFMVLSVVVLKCTVTFSANGCSTAKINLFLPFSVFRKRFHLCACCGKWSWVTFLVPSLYLPFFQCLVTPTGQLRLVHLRTFSLKSVKTSARYDPNIGSHRIPWGDQKFLVVEPCRNDVF